VREAAAINLDLFPTFFALAGLALPEDRLIDGRDMMGLLTGSAEDPTHEAFFFYHYDRIEAVRSGRWKYYRRVHRYTWPIPLDAAPLPNGLGRNQLGDRWPLLYDLAADPGESYNLRLTYPQTADAMEALMQEWEASVQADPRGFAGMGGSSIGSR
jgi:arylsulfatase A-like enzyme